MTKHLPRRTLLRGAGVACALPSLEAMLGAGAAARAATPRPRRFCAIYTPNGVSIPGPDHPAHAEWSWFPIGRDRDFKLTRTQESLEPFRKQLTIAGGLSHPRSRNLLGHAAGDTFLTGGDIGGEYKNSISLDQVAARQLGRATRHACLTLSCDGGIGYKSRVSTLSFGPSGNALPSESSPRQIFERTCNPGDAQSDEATRRRLREGRKVVDLVKADSQDLARHLGRDDKDRLDEYLGTLAEIEDRIDRAESWIGKPVKKGETGHLQLGAVQANPGEYIRTMLDLIVLAFQIDATRIATYMVAREDGMGWGDQFPVIALGLPGGHHKLSHDRDEGFHVRWSRYDQWLVKHFAYFLERMSKTRDEHGSLLENTVVLYGSACSTTHNARNYPLVLAGGQRMGLKHGQYRQFSEATPLSNLYVSLLGALGVPAPSFADSTGKLDAIFT
jgi:hypothetical protein